MTYEVIRRQGSLVCQLLDNAVLAAAVDAGQSPCQFTDFELDALLASIAQDERFGSIVNLTISVEKVSV